MLGMVLFLDSVRIIYYSTIERNTNTRTLTMIETINNASTIFGTLAVVWFAGAAFVGVLVTMTSR